MQEAILVDIDGTAAIGIGQHRGPFDYEKVMEDGINYMVWEVISRMSKDYNIIFVSGRENKLFDDGNEYDNCFDLTHAWLHKYIKLFEMNTYPILYMRAEGYNRKDSIVKQEIYETSIKPKFDVKLCVDDRTQVVEMWRKLGLPCWQVAKGDF